MLLLQADVLELKANPNAPASGPIIESRLDVGRGPVATMLVQRGTLKAGDAIVAGDAWGKVRAMLDENGERLQEAGPAVPVEILGFDHPPPAGELARVVESEREARAAGAEARPAPAHGEPHAARQKSVSLEDLFRQIGEGAVRELALIIKGDVQGSVEAAVSELQKIKSDEVAVNVIHTGVGGIAESDVMLAAASKAIVVGFNVRPNAEARQLAEREGVDIRTYRVIYQLTEDIEKALVGLLAPKHGRGRHGRGRGARAVQGLAAGHDRRLHGHATAPSQRSRAGAAWCATARWSGTARSTRSSTSRTTCARSRRASSAASCSQGYNDLHGGRRARGVRVEAGRAHRAVAA